MNVSNKFWFHCGRCGALFQAAAGAAPDRLCVHCGAHPSPGILESPADAAAPVPEAAPNVDAQPDSAGTRKHRSGKHRKNRYLMLKLTVGWTLVLVVIVVGARMMWHDHKPAGATSVATPKTDPVSNEDIVFLNDAAPKCAEIISGFLAAGTPESRNQFVLTPVRTSSRMARFYDLNPLANIDPATLSLTDRAVLELPGGKAVETQWNGPDGRKIEAVFREENGEWRLDWDHFARYSDYPWSLFLAGSGDSEGEFRLLARERLADERKGSDTISMVLYAPRFGQPGEAGFQSPEFLVSRNSRDGRLLDEAFKLARSGKQVFGSRLKHSNPEGMIRTRLKVRRVEVNRERKFEIVQVLACHWYAVDEPGVELPAAAAEAPAAATEPPQTH